MVSGLLALIALTLVRLGRERQFYELTLREQAGAIEAGLRTKWKSFLLEAAIENRLPKDFLITWDRLGKTMKTAFYPIPGIRLEWAEYREAKKQSNLEGQKKFLAKALDLSRSWDRILAIEEWENFKPDPRPGPELTGYEKTVIDPEAREAYRKIIYQFETGKDFTFAKRESELDEVFYQMNADGELEGFLPSIGNVRANLGDTFSKSNNLSEIQFGLTVLDIQFPQFQTIASRGFNFLDTFLLSASALLLTLGVVITAAGIREQRRTLSQRVSFLNQVVHELKTPLAGLKLNTQLMKRGGASEGNLQAILESTTRLDRLFDDIVQINRHDQAASLGPISPESFSQLLGELTESQSVEIEGVITKPVFTELGRLRVLLRNLISNGVKYGKKVTVVLNEIPAGLQITVKDSGPGIGKADAPHIFDEFFRSEQARKIETDGLGLGLSLVKKLARELGTNVVLANPGKPGAEFCFTLSQKEERA